MRTNLLELSVIDKVEAKFCFCTGNLTFHSEASDQAGPGPSLQLVLTARRLAAPPEPHAVRREFSTNILKH